MSSYRCLNHFCFWGSILEKDVGIIIQWQALRFELVNLFLNVLPAVDITFSTRTLTRDASKTLTCETKTTDKKWHFDFPFSQNRTQGSSFLIFKAFLFI